MSKKLTIEDMRQIAEERCGECLSEEYIDSKTKLRWRCAEGHEWSARIDSIKNGSWCPYCSGRIGHSCKDLQTYIDKHHPGGKVIGKYVGETAKVEVQCNKNSSHKWMVTPSKVKNGRWCPYCSDRVKKTKDDIQKWIDKHHPGAKIIGTYVNTHTPIQIRCNKNPLHVWTTTAHRITSGQWCPFCAGKAGHSEKELQEYIDKYHPGGRVIGKYINHSTPVEVQCVCGNKWKVPPTNIMTRKSWCMECSGKKKGTTKEIQEYIDMNHTGGKVLDEYINALTKIRFQCADGHTWSVEPAYIKQGQWCPTCAGTLPLTIEEMKEIARKRGGECLSEECINNMTKLRWRCVDGHKWEAIPDSVKRGSWCPYCAGSLGESITRKIFEAIFHKDFPSVWPEWLRNQNGNKMELDGFNDSLRLAFEYQGSQHYIESPELFHRDRTLDSQKEHDRVKRELCIQNGITLIEVPYSVSYEDMPTYIWTKCKHAGYDIDKPDLIVNELFIDEVRNASKLEEMKKIAKERRWECLSKVYINSKTKLRWRCSKGHEWKATPDSIKRGTGCPECAGRLPLTIEDMQKLAKERRGKCLSRVYINNRTKLRWQCSKGHEWEATPSSIKTGAWCPVCAGVMPSTIEEMKEIARSREGKCLSETYINNRTKLWWKCSKGHEWWARPHDIKKGAWCPVCAGKASLTIEEMKQLAKERGGKCLSEVYTNSHTKLRWRCAKGHEWWARPYNIKNGTWCPVCAKKRRGRKQHNNNVENNI